MDDLNSGIRRVAEELRAVQEQLKQAGLLTEENDRRMHRWELARHISSLVERLQMYLLLHHQTAKLAPYRHSERPMPLQAPRPD